MQMRDLLYFGLDNDSQKKAYIKAKKLKTKRIPMIKVPVNHRVYTAYERVKSCVQGFTVDYRVNFCQFKGMNIMKRKLTENDFIKILKNGIGYSISTAVVVVLLLGSVAVFDLRLGSEVIVNGKSVGDIYDYDGFNAIVEEAKELSKAASSNEKAGDYSIVYIPKLVAAKDATPDFKLRQALLADCTGMIEAYAVYVSGELVGATMKEEDSFGAMNDLKERFGVPGQEITFTFDNELAVRKEYVALKQLLSREGLVSVLSGEQQFTEVYTAIGEDTLTGVAEYYGMSVDEIYAINSNISEDLYEGQKINVVLKKALVSVKGVYTAEYIEKIPFETNKVEDSNIIKGRTEEAIQGIEGERKVVATISKINGVEVSRDIISDQVVSEPQHATIKVGTGDSEAVSIAGALIDNGSAHGTGTFLRPASGVISSRFGPRSRGDHTGLDIAGGYGSNIMAADSGTVTCAGWSGSYGLLVKIDHENGYVTYYAHCSSIQVSVGQRVKKGQVISKIGSTGNSTGPHLHFEVRKNGVPQNPMSYIN